jgi:hypothetical protein
MLSKKIISIVITYTVLSITGGIIFFIVDNYIIANIKSLPVIYREGFINTFPTSIAFASVFLLLSYISYSIIIRICVKYITKLFWKSILATILSFIITEGINNTLGGFVTVWMDLAIFQELLIIGAMAGIIPYLEAYVFKRLKNK